MTAAEINTLSDADLVTAVALQLFDWPPPEYRGREIRATVADLVSSSCRAVAIPEPWSPLLCWDHCWMVVEAMRAKGWDFEFIGRLITNDKPCIIFYPEWNSTKTIRIVSEKGDERRAILRATLMAVNSGTRETAPGTVQGPVYS